MRHRRSCRRDDHRCFRRPLARVRRGRARAASASGPARGRGKPARVVAGVHARRHCLSSGASFPAVAARQLANARAARVAFRYRLGLGTAGSASRSREVLSTFPAVSWRQEASAAGQLFAAMRAAGARSGARCAGAGRAGDRYRTQRRHRQPADFSGCGARTACRASAAGKDGDFRRSFPRYAAGAGDELSESGHSGAGVDFRASSQQAGRSGHQRRSAGFPDWQRGRHRIGFHDRAVHRSGDRQRSGHARASGQRVFDPDQRERRGSRFDGRERSAPRARDEPRSRPGARAGAVHRRAGAGFPPRHDQCCARTRGRQRCGRLRHESAGWPAVRSSRSRGVPE